MNVGELHPRRQLYIQKATGIEGLVVGSSWLLLNLFFCSSELTMLSSCEAKMLPFECDMCGKKFNNHGCSATGVKVGSPHSMKHGSTVATLCGSRFDPDCRRRHAKLILKRYGV